MTPKQYLDRYTYFKIKDPVYKRDTEAPVTGYGAGWTTAHRANGPACQQEYLTYFRPALGHAVNGNKNRKPDSIFFVESTLPGLAPMECFCKMSFIRAFLGKGSPDEITDTVRMAWALGRIGLGKDILGKPPAAPTVADYVTKFISLDCNGLSGNYYGINPETAVSGYASGGRKRMSAADVRVGDIVVTVTAEGKYKHVAVLDKWQPLKPGAKTGPVNLTLCEWGMSGGEDNHYNQALREATFGPNKAYGIGFTRNILKNFRYIFAPPKREEERGWGLGANMAA